MLLELNLKKLPQYKIEKARVSTTLLKQQYHLAHITSFKSKRDLF